MMQFFVAADAFGKAVSLKIQSQRAFFAAESGAHVGVVKVLGANSCYAMSTLVNFSQSGLVDNSATLKCNALFTKLAGLELSVVYSITSTCQCVVGDEESKRVVEVRIR